MGLEEFVKPNSNFDNFSAMVETQMVSGYVYLDTKSILSVRTTSIHLNFSENQTRASLVVLVQAVRALISIQCLKIKNKPVRWFTSLEFRLKEVSGVQKSIWNSKMS